ncbi:uracil-DNA glycosylase [Hydrogenovibrio marinus]|uniref:Uracil-DNA glycosylase n=1 Tax=Hydrogenovibrio marinus TaxID=28885 RepID=A0A066ZZF9_HYDMR|nr:uracil-DNA glycosylase [Hydrogenovibrio marinus]KDN95721.1 uracil-DNA glycosylase [Hydrogenovibrio marinus]BBN58797.1 uracil-DNA glycosylase [Hydrogenovibrio marinus]
MTNTNHMIDLEASWLSKLKQEFDMPYMQQLKAFLLAEKQQGKTILPKGSLWFNALNSTPFDQVKVVVLGQDPYPTPGHAHGLSFSVLPGVSPLPKSLLNINQELLTDVGVNNAHTGYLQPWADQGVLLLNAVLTVEAGKPNAHQNKGWEQFTDKIVHLLAENNEHLVFILWGAYAQKKGKFIDRKKHFVIESPHPSPLSAYRGFFGSQPFSKTNSYLQQHGQTPINWQLPVASS